MNWNDLRSQSRVLLGILHGSRAFTGPFQASIELTNRCNLRCIHCYFYSPYVDRPNFFSLRRARQQSKELPDLHDLERLQTLDADSDGTREVIDTLVKMGTRKFFFTGSGEPLLHRDLLDFIARAKHAGSTCIVYTNGTLLDHSTIDQLIGLRCNELKITTLAGSEDVYAKTHSGVRQGTFHDLRNNLRYLAERRDELGAAYPEVSLHYVVIPQNCFDIRHFVEFADSVRAKRVVFRPVDAIGDQGLERHIMPTAEQEIEVREQLAGITAHLDSRGIAHNVADFLKVFRGDIDTAALYRVIPCYYGWLGLRVDVTGQVYPCCRCYEPIGNVHERDLRDIWHGSRYRSFRSKSIGRTSGEDKEEGCECANCPHFTANLLVFNALHPLKSRSSALRRLSSAGMER